jgi:fructokinase
MILSVGEILADMIGQKEDGVTTFKAFCGGAPFNLAVNAKQSGAKVGFVGRVGNDVIGRFVLCEAQKEHLDRLDIQIDAERNTTIAFVTLTDGERDFAFNRHDTADFNIDFDDIDFESYENLEIVHLGSLMLSEQKGREFAEKIANKASELGAKLSFDMNFRKDIYKNFEDAKRAYAPFVECADIIKFSDDELTDYTGISDMDEAAKSVLKKDKLLLVTLGKSGSAYYYNDLKGIVPSISGVKCVDTTGAGDAFFGAFLTNIEGKELTEENIVYAMQQGNIKGAKTTEFYGAIEL